MILSVIATATIFSALPRIQTKGQSLVLPDGSPVLLTGVNFGGWLVEEIWMTPWKNRESEAAVEVVRDHSSLWETIEKRLGREASLRIRSAWRENWITQHDFDTVKSLGLNHVRLPFLHTLLDEPNGMKLLKSAVSQARKAGLWVVLDMHGTPGGQSHEHHTGKEKLNRLWFDVENITEMEMKWKRLAKEFRNDTTVAIYDIMNEPMGAPNPAMLSIVYDRVIRAIRSVDREKVVLVDDGYKGFETTSHPNLAKWTQVGFSLHFYQFEADSPEKHGAILEAKIPRIKELQGYRDAPLYIGEFQLEPHYSPSGMKKFVGQMEKAGWSWSVWTWKACGQSGPVGHWGLFRPKEKIEPCDPFHDSEVDLIRKIRSYRTENWFAPQENLNAVAKELDPAY
jgi:hypothetical protein